MSPPVFQLVQLNRLRSRAFEANSGLSCSPGGDAGGAERLDVPVCPEPDAHDFLTEKIFPRQADVITTAELEELLSPRDS